jgi:hypothetical protein
LLLTERVETAAQFAPKPVALNLEPVHLLLEARQPRNLVRAASTEQRQRDSEEQANDERKEHRSIMRNGVDGARPDLRSRSLAGI